MRLTPTTGPTSRRPVRVLVTGSSGRVGRSLPAVPGFDLVPFDLPHGDVLDLAALRRAASDCELVVHLAWDLREDVHTGTRCAHNVTMAKNVLDTALQLGVGRVVLASSVHAGALTRPRSWRRVDVRDAPQPATPYGRSKLVVEDLGRQAAADGLDVVAVRLGAVGQDRASAGPERARWLHPADLRGLLTAALCSPVVPGRFLLLHGVSRGWGRRHRLDNDLGWRPVRLPLLHGGTYDTAGGVVPDPVIPSAASEERDLPSTPVRVQYVIGTSPRSGSSLLCELLAQQGCFGAPSEVFMTGPVRPWQERAAGGDPLELARSVRTTANGCFGMKLMADHLPTWLAADTPERVLATRVVLLTRRDLVGQAVSWATAVQTGAWNSTQSARAASWYDRASVQRHVRRAALGEATWRAFTATLGLPVLEVTYEELVDDPEAVLQRVADFLGVDLPVLPVLTGVALQQQRGPAREADLRFVEEARADLRDGGVTDELLLDLMRRPVGARAAVRAAVVRRLPPASLGVLRALRDTVQRSAPAPRSRR